jgi:hypothetical protein
MKKSGFFAAILLAGVVLAPSLAAAADMDLRGAYRSASGYAYGLPYPLSLNHNYGPGREPGSFTYYDGPATVRCYQSAAAYLGQDNRRHPCF